MKINTYIVNWQGPYEDSNISEIEGGTGLYSITGYQRYDRENQIQYCGISEQEFAVRLGNQHHKKDLVTRERQYWIGKINSNKRILREDLELVETLIIYFWQPVLNEKKKKSCPMPTVVINRWFDINGRIRINSLYEGQNLHDVIYWDGNHWHFSNKLKIYENE